MVEIEALKCPGCGGSLIDATKPCRFCGTKIIIADKKTKFSLAGRICQKCGSENENRNRYCNKCGENFFIRCPKCNSDIDSLSIHCSNCGVNINEEIEKKYQEEEELRRKEEEVRQREEARRKEEEEKKIKIEYEEKKRIETEINNKKARERNGKIWMASIVLTSIAIIFITYIFIISPANDKQKKIDLIAEQNNQKMKAEAKRSKDIENSNDEILWSEAKNKNNIEYYNKYLNSSKLGTHRIEAESKILEIKNRISSLSSIKNLDWKIILNLRAKTFYGDKINPVLKRNAWDDKGPSEWMTDAWIGVNHCDEWDINLNAFDKGQILNKTKNEINSVKDENIVQRVKFSQFMVLNKYNFENNFFELSLCGSEHNPFDNIEISIYDNSATLKYREIQQPDKKCSQLMKANRSNEYPSISFKKPYDDLIYFKTTKENAKIIIETLSSEAEVCGYSYSQKSRNEVIGSVFVDYVADISSNYSGGSRFGALDAKIVGAYIWKDATRKKLLGTTGKVTEESAYK